MKKYLFLILLFVNLCAIAQVQYPQGGTKSVVNSTVVTLTSGSTFTGTSEDVSRYVEIRVSVYSDVASATDGFGFQGSNDGTNWFFVGNQYTVPAATGKEWGIGRSVQFFRAVYINGGTNQATFQLTTTYFVSRTKPSSVRMQDGRGNDNDVEEIAAYGNDYDPVANQWNRTTHFQNITGQSAQTATVNNIMTATAGSTGSNVGRYVFGSTQIVSTGTGGTFIFESANSDGNYVTMNVYNNASLTGTPISAAITPTASSLIYYYPITTNFIRTRIATTITGGTIQALTKLNDTSPHPAIVTVAQPTAANLNATVGGTVAVSSITTAVVPGTAATNLGKAEDLAATSADVGVAIFALRNDALTNNVNASGDYIVPVTDLYGSLVVKDQQIHKRTYTAAFTVAPSAAATDIFQLIGSATTTVEITKVTISGTQTTGAMNNVIFSKRSTANTGGTSSGATIFPNNSADAAATAVGAIYTANPSTGTPVGDFEVLSVPFSGVTATTNNIIDRRYGINSKPVILNGVAQAFAIRLNGATLGGGSINISIEFTEY